MPSVNTVANGPAAESPEAVAVAVAVSRTKTSPSASASPSPAASPAATKGRGLRRWRRVRRDQERPRDSTGGGSGGEGGAHLLHKPWLALAAAAATGATNGNHDASAADAEAESSTASVVSRLVAPGPGLGFSVAGAGNSDSEDRRGSRSCSSTAATAPHHGHASVVLLSPRQWHSPRPRAAVPIATEAGCSRSSFESDSGLRSSTAVKARHRQQQQQLGHRRGGGNVSISSVVGRSASARFSAAAGDDESVGNGDFSNGRMHSDADPCNQSNLLLQSAQEALENEIEKIMAIRNDEFDVSDDEWSGSVHLEEPNEDLMVRIKHLESSLEEASALVKEKASRIYELEAIRGQMQPGKTTIESINLLLSQCGLDQLYQERMESEIQCIILTRAYQASATLAEDQMTLYETQKTVSEDYKLLGLRLRHTESRAVVLEEMAEKLQLQCKELSNSSEVLQLRYKASRVSLFCFIQFLLLFIALGNYLMRLSPSSTKVLPT